MVVIVVNVELVRTTSSSSGGGRGSSNATTTAGSGGGGGREGRWLDHILELVIVVTTWRGEG